MQKLALFPFLLLLCISAPVAAQEAMTLDAYLAQVESKNPDIKAVTHTIEAIDQKTTELETPFVPVIGGNLSYTRDKSGPQIGSTLPTDSMDAVALNLSVSKRWTTGSKLSINYTDSAASFQLLYPAQVLGPDKLSAFAGYQIHPVISVEQSLLKETKNGMTMSGIRKAQASAYAGEYLQLFKKQQILQQARAAYWSLSLAREVAAFRNISLERARKILKWNDDKYNFDLVDKSDLLQAQGSYKMRELNLQTAMEDEVRASRTYNELRGVSSDVVPEQIEKLSDATSTYVTVDKLSKNGDRADVLSAKEALMSARYAHREATLRTGPDASLFGSAALTGLDMSYGGAWTQLAYTDKPTYTIGIMFSTPLDFRVNREVRAGYARDVDAANESLLKTKLSESNAWDDLVKTWEGVKKRLSLAYEIRDIQARRLSNEQYKAERGRTTTFMLLTAENDLDDATLNVYRLIYEELTVLSQAELFNTKPF